LRGRLVNLVNNALKYSKDDKYIGVKLYRDNGAVKLEVPDHGIGIARRDQTEDFREVLSRRRSAGS
jgi:signal transduction histidine kinase